MSDTEVKFPKKPKTEKPPVRKRPKNENPNGGDDENESMRGVFLFIASIAAIILAFYFFQKPMGSMDDIQLSKLKEMVRVQKETGQKTIESLVFVRENTGKAYIEGKYLKKAEKTGQNVSTAFHTNIDTDWNRDLPAFLASNGFPDIDTKPVDNLWSQTLIGMLPFLLFVLFLYFLFRQQIKMAGKNAFTFGKSRAKMLSRDKKKITFKDVAGVEEAKDEVQEIVDFLKDPKKFSKLGGRIPKGVLMVGPPGTGKTLIAKAIAGEADVPFFSISGSDFVEMFVGVGASRVRDMFEQGRKNAPCLIFIDEIDAVGRARGTGMGGGHDEREQTLNAMLVEMDGIDSHEGIIMIAATNRKDVLDPALLRPGRFDREVMVNLPDIKGREEILKVHAQKVKLDIKADLHLIARGTPGFSGAELANLLNEAALLAVRRGKESIEQSELEESRDKVRWGRERRSMAMTEEQKKITAYHEAGHALLNVLLEHTDPLHKVSIIPRGPALGVTMMLPKEDLLGHSRRKIIDDLCVTMGGRVAEEIFIGDISSGASGDINMATWYAKKMVCDWGMSEKLGMVHYGGDSNMTFLGRDLGSQRSYSESTAQTIDKEVLELVNSAYQRAKQLILEHRDKMELITQALLDYEVLDGHHIIDLIKEGKMNNPPIKKIDPPSNPTPSEPLPANPPAAKPKKDDGLLPGFQGAPA
ncbi:MAG: ATP-dependent zinc metalloprotease FtsH [Verrucomicrobiota bacterium]